MTVRELNGWTPATVTVDPGGEVVSVTVTETRFPPRQVALLLASRRAELDPRGDHGLPLSVSMDPANQFARWKVRRRADFADIALHKEQALFEKTYPHEDAAAQRWIVELED